jgi:hypothetical protein
MRGLAHRQYRCHSVEMVRPIVAFLLAAGITSGCTGKDSPHHDGGAANAQSDDRSCVKTHPLAASDIEPAVRLQTVDDCESDDGPCQASTECKGSVEDRICDADRFISPGAALCIADAAGLDSGLNGLSASITYNYGYRRVIWAVRNVLHDEGPGGSSSGTVMFVDGVSSEILGSFGWSATP